MTKLRVVYTERHKLHSDPTGLHPESPRRVEDVVQTLSQEPLRDYVEFVEPPGPDYRVLELAHSREYIEWVRGECARGFHYIDADTYLNEHTCDIAASFARASWDSALRALNGDITIILTRPGGHHAGRSGRAMGAPTLGFCIFDYVSVAALELAGRGYKAAVVDFDAHHGNGSQEILWDEPRVLHVDVHEWGIYPGTGWVTDIGGPRARGTKINIPLYRGSGDGEFAWVLERAVKPAVEIFRPDVIVVFAGFDAHAGDPLTGLEATEATYLSYGHYIGQMYERGSISGAVIVLGGGYGRGMRRGFEAFARGLVSLDRPHHVEPRPPGSHVEGALPFILERLRETATSPA